MVEFWDKHFNQLKTDKSINNCWAGKQNFVVEHVQHSKLDIRVGLWSRKVFWPGLLVDYCDSRACLTLRWKPIQKPFSCLSSLDCMLYNRSYCGKIIKNLWPSFKWFIRSLLFSFWLFWAVFVSQATVILVTLWWWKFGDVCHEIVMWWIGHQRLKRFPDTFRLQQPSPISM